MTLKHTILSVTEALRVERDRFVAFAFASADILIEIGDDEKILYLDGATLGFMGESYETLHGTSFLDYLTDDSRETWQKLRDEVKNFDRSDSHRMTLKSKRMRALPIAASAITLPGRDDSIFLSISVVHHDIVGTDVSGRDHISGLFHPGEYAKRTSERLRELTSQGEEARLSLIELSEIKPLLDSLPPEKARALTMEIADYLREISIASDSASQIDASTYSVLHNADFEAQNLITTLQSTLTRFGATQDQLGARFATVDGNVGTLSVEDSARAILYTLNQFADSSADFTLASLENSYAQMLEQTVERITKFKGTVNEDSFDLAYQPIVDLRHGIIHHHEALVRLNHEAFENPFHFINFGEQTGLINDFDLAMCRRVLEVLTEAGKENRHPVVAVNISGKSLSSQLFMDAMEQLLRQYAKHRKQLIIEVTESAKIQDMQRANNFLQEMRRRGNLCCLDDFGVAESSFDYLRHLHVDYIKIDGSYVRETLETTRGRHLLRAMVGMCRSLGMTTIGEMVEDEKTAAILWESGVHYGQGWLFGKPDTDPKELKNYNRLCENYSGILYNSATETIKKDTKPEAKLWYEGSTGL